MQGMALLKSSFLRRIGEVLNRPVHSGMGGMGGWGNFGFSRGGYDYKAEAGPLYESSIPLACLKWEQRASIEAEVCAQKRNESGDWENDNRAPILDLLFNPNPHFDIHQLLDALRFDYHLAGNSYLYKARSGSGKVVQLWWIPSGMIEPRWEETGTEFISCYEYSVNGRIYAIPVADIIHFRNGIDPRSHGRKGLSDFAAVLREVCTDNESAVIAATLCRNMGIPGVIIAPKSTQGIDTQLTKEQRNQFKEMWQESFTGERRGEPFVQSIPVDITMPGFSPQQMLMDKMRAIPEMRITAAFGIPASVLGLMAGVENSKTKGGRGDEREQAYESCIIPTLYTLARTLTRQLMSEFDDVKTARIWFDLSDVRVLQQDEDALFKRMDSAWKNGWLKRSEVREKTGYESTPEDEIYCVKDKPLAKDVSGNSPAISSNQVADETTAAQTDATAAELKALRASVAVNWNKAVKADV